MTSSSDQKFPEKNNLNLPPKVLPKFLPKILPKLLIAASRKSSGKTTITLGLARAFSKRGLSVQTFKKGPDYIDPLWLEQASSSPCYNLDFNTQSQGEIVNIFSHYGEKKDLAIVETNKGLFDGVDVLGSDANAQLAKILKIPIILVLDTIGMTRGIAPLLHGYSTFDPDIVISAIILNKTGGSRHENKLRSAIEQYSDIPVLGCIARNEELSINERHLGLTTPGEKSASLALIDQLALSMENFVDLDKLLEIAKSPGHNLIVNTQPQPIIANPDIDIAIARDEAFGFYYPDDLYAMRRAGARIHYFSPLNDEKLPPADGLIIGGGFPENFLQKLKANHHMRTQIKSAIKAGLPTYAECGGLMYLSRSITWDKGATGALKDTDYTNTPIPNSKKCAQMVGIIPGDCHMHQKPLGRGFARLEKTPQHPWIKPDCSPNSDADSSGQINAHEFHYASINNLPDDIVYAYKIKRGHGIDGTNDGIVINNMLANFCHFRQTSRSQWVQNFVDFARTYKNR